MQLLSNEPREHHEPTNEELGIEPLKGWARTLFGWVVAAYVIGSCVAVWYLAGMLWRLVARSLV